LHREQEEREERQRELRDLGLPPNADDMDPGALSDADPHTTNLYVGNLAPGVDEDLLKKVRSCPVLHKRSAQRALTESSTNAWLGGFW
jgi:hypothetical protein